MRFALGVEYDGGRFSGWQRLSTAGTQVADGSLQTALEMALSKVAAGRIDTICAGRTDAGVHARCQVVHFDTGRARTPRAAAGRQQPPAGGVAVRWCAAGRRRFQRALRGARTTLPLPHPQSRARAPGMDRDYLTWERHAAGRRRHAPRGAGAASASTISARSAPCNARRRMRGRDLHEIRCAATTTRWWSRCRPTPSCTTWCATSSAALLLVGRGERPSRLDRANCWQAATAAWPGRPRRPAGLLFLGPRYPRQWRLPQDVCSELRSIAEGPTTEARAVPYPHQVLWPDPPRRRAPGRRVGRGRDGLRVRRAPARAGSSLDQAAAPAPGAAAAGGRGGPVHGQPRPARSRDAIAHAAADPAAVPRQRGRCVLPALRPAVPEGTVPMGQGAADAALARKRYPSAQPASCWTAMRPAQPGGSGERVRLDHHPARLSRPVLLAGGLAPDNVCAAIRAARAVRRGRVERHRKRAGHQGRRKNAAASWRRLDVQTAEWPTATSDDMPNAADIASISARIRTRAGHFGRYGGRVRRRDPDRRRWQNWRPPTTQYSDDPAVPRRTRATTTRHYVGRPEPDLPRGAPQPRNVGGARILLKREDLNHTGAHKINNTIGQGLLASAWARPASSPRPAPASTAWPAPPWPRAWAWNAWSTWAPPTSSARRSTCSA